MNNRTVQQKIRINGEAALAASDAFHNLVLALLKAQHRAHSANYGSFGEPKISEEEMEQMTYFFVFGVEVPEFAERIEEVLQVARAWRNFDSVVYALEEQEREEREREEREQGERESEQRILEEKLSRETAQDTSNRENWMALV